MPVLSKFQEKRNADHLPLEGGWVGRGDCSQLPLLDAHLGNREQHGAWGGGPGAGGPCPGTQCQQPTPLQQQKEVQFQLPSGITIRQSYHKPREAFSDPSESTQVIRNNNSRTLGEQHGEDVAWPQDLRCRWPCRVLRASRARRPAMDSRRWVCLGGADPSCGGGSVATSTVAPQHLGA